MRGPLRGAADPDVAATVSAMTTLQNRPHTALLVVDVQNSVVDGSPPPRRRRGKHRQPRRTRTAAGCSGDLGSAQRRRACAGQRWLGRSSRNFARTGRAAGRQELWRLFRGHDPRAASWPTSGGPARRRRRGDRCLRAVDAARRVRPRLRRHAGRRRPHRAGQDAVGRPSVEAVIAHTNLYWAYRPRRAGRRKSSRTEAVD